MLKLFEMQFDNTYDDGRWSEPFFAALFSIAILILWVAYFRNRKSKEMESATLNDFVEIQQNDILGQPITLMNNNQFPKEGVLFNSGAKGKFIPNFLIVLGAFIVFGLIVGVLK